MRRLRFFSGRVILLLLTLAVVGPSLGCIGMSSHLMYVFTGPPTVPAKFEGLRDKRVAVVCVSDASTFGPVSEASLLARHVGRILQNKVRRIEVVPDEEIVDWIDENAWDHTDYKTIGRGVKADVVLAIDMASFSIREGSTLYRGRANLATKVYDMTQGGRIVYENSMPEMSFPKNGGRPVTDTTESQFRQTFMGILVEDVARQFYAYERREDFGRDSVLMK